MDLRLMLIEPVRDATLYEDRNYADDAGVNLYVTEDVTVEPHTTVFVGTGVAGQPVVGNQSYMMMARSKIVKTKLRLANSVGLIDGGYRGEIKAVFDNIGDKAVTIHRGESYVQLVAFNGLPIRVTWVDRITPTPRQNGGFGSTDSTKLALNNQLLE